MLPEIKVNNEKSKTLLMDLSSLLIFCYCLYLWERKYEGKMTRNVFVRRLNEKRGKMQMDVWGQRVKEKCVGCAKGKASVFPVLMLLPLAPINRKMGLRKV